jgi:hypothetical protein
MLNCTVKYTGELGQFFLKKISEFAAPQHIYTGYIQ